MMQTRQRGLELVVATEPRLADMLLTFGFFRQHFYFTFDSSFGRLRVHVR